MGLKNENYNPKMDEMLFLLVEDALDKDGVESIEKWLATGASAKQYYLHFISDYAAMKSQVASLIDADAESLAIRDEYDSELWSALAEVEKVAESIPETKSKPEQELKPIQKIEREKIVYKFSKSSLVVFAVSMAALIFMILFLHFSPTPSIEVATLSDSVDAVFAGNVSYFAGDRLSSQADSLWLQKGILKIEFDYGAEVIIEAPAEFCLKTADNLSMRSGRLYAHVPGRSKGFTVETPSASIIDLGTEFAVKVDFNGAIDVHMLKGKASLIPGIKGQTAETSQILTVNQARRVTPSGEVRDIPVKSEDFVCDINSQTGFVWRGQEAIDLADIVGGGNGFGTGNLEYGINVKTGILARRSGAVEAVTTYVGFTPIPDNPYIDGVFVPAKGATSIQVSTQDHRFENCPQTSGRYWGYIMNGGWFGASPREEKVPPHAFRLNNQAYGTREHPAIVMHSNLGITFDLQLLRESIGYLKIKRFTALCGISETVFEMKALQKAPKASFFVLLDGEKKFEKIDVAADSKPAAIELDIPQTARFLTLIAAEGGDQIYDGDWSLFAEPKLHFGKSE